MWEAAKSSRATAAALGAIGVMWGCIAALVPDLKQQAGLDQAGLGIALFFAAFGGFVSMYLAPRTVPRLGAHALPMLTVIAGLVLILPGFATGFAALAGPLFLLGLSIAMLDMGANMRIAETEAETGVPLMNFNHGIFSLVFALSALFSGFLRAQGASPPQILTASCVIILCFAAYSIERKTVETGARPASQTPHDAALPWRAILLAAVILFAAFVGENAIESWTALYLETELQAAAGEGSLGPFAFGAVMAVGRFSGQLFVRRLGPQRLVFISGVLGATGACLLAIAPSQTVAILAIGITALGLSTVVPNANTLLVMFAAKGQRGLALSRAWMVGFVGFFIGPSMIGLIAEATSLRVAFGCVAGLIALILPAVMGLGRMRARG